MLAQRLTTTLLALSVATVWAPAIAGAPIADDEATFVNLGYFVSVTENFGQLEITENMLQRGETSALVALLEVHASTPYALRVELDKVDLAGSLLNPNHPRGLDGRDAFLFRVTDKDGWPSEWHVGSQPLLLTGQASTLTDGRTAEHRVEVKLQFVDGDGDIFSRARPGTYSATFFFEVEEDVL